MSAKGHPVCEVQGEVWEMCVLYDEGFASGGVVSCRGGGGAGGGVVEDESDEEEEVVSFFFFFWFCYSWSVWGWRVGAG